MAAPDAVGQFRDVGYWDEFFRKRNNEAFEWYGDWQQLSPLLSPHVDRAGEVLIVGCGNSMLGEHMHAAGFRQLVSVDYSAQVIDEMRQKTQPKEGLTYEVMDMHALGYADGRFQTVLDKAWLDAVLTVGTPEEEADVAAMMREAQRVLKPGGKYVVVTLAQPHIVRFLLDFFPHDGWEVDVQLMGAAEGVSLQTYVFSFRRLLLADREAGAGGISCNFDDSHSFAAAGARSARAAASRLRGPTAAAEAAERITRSQHLAAVRRDIAQLRGGRVRLSTSLWGGDDGAATARFELTVVDREGQWLLCFGNHTNASVALHFGGTSPIFSHDVTRSYSGAVLHISGGNRAFPSLAIALPTRS